MKKRTGLNAIEIRDDLDGYLNDLDISEITEFEGSLGSDHFRARVVSGGFGLPHVILTICHEGEFIELALMESDSSDDYEQDGSDPLQADGWKWRRGEPEMMTGGWSDEMYSDPALALEAAILILSDATD